MNDNISQRLAIGGIILLAFSAVVVMYFRPTLASSLNALACGAVGGLAGYLSNGGKRETAITTGEGTAITTESAPEVKP